MNSDLSILFLIEAVAPKINNQPDADTNIFY